MRIRSSAAFGRRESTSRPKTARASTLGEYFDELLSADELLEKSSAGSPLISTASSRVTKSPSSKGNHPMALQDVLAELAVNLRLDSAAYSAGVDKASQKTTQLERRLSAFQKSAGGIGKTMASLAGGLTAGFAAGFGIDAIVRATQAALEYAGSLAETAQQLGVTARDLQVFRFAAGQVGVSRISSKPASRN
jgi:hypothetical protein